MKMEMLQTFFKMVVHYEEVVTHLLQNWLIFEMQYVACDGSVWGCGGSE
jgi:hypothetical protein